MKISEVSVGDLLEHTEEVFAFLDTDLYPKMCIRIIPNDLSLYLGKSIDPSTFVSYHLLLHCKTSQIFRWYLLEHIVCMFKLVS